MPQCLGGATQRSHARVGGGGNGGDGCRVDTADKPELTGNPLEAVEAAVDDAADSPQSARSGNTNVEGGGFGGGGSCSVLRSRKKLA